MNIYCKQCQKNFQILESDQIFYAKMGFPTSQNCSSCRYQQRLSFRNERQLYKRKCSGTGRNIISIFSEEKPFSVYAQDYWWSDKWDAKSYGKKIDFNKTFFEQFAELFQFVPRLAINNSESENCEYTNQSQRNKNCYLVVASNYNEDCYYGAWYQNCKDSMDCLYLERSELCYEIVNGKNCYHCTYSQNLENCTDVHFSKNLIGCKSCFGCINLRNKEYHIFNKPYSRESYFFTLKNLQWSFNQLNQFFLSQPHKYYVGKNNEYFTGDYIQEVKQSFEVYNCRYSENSAYCQDTWKARNCRDLTETLENDFCLELEGCDGNVDLAFCMKNHYTSSSRYSAHCFFSKHLFGCVGLRQSEYCILNKQYNKEAYEALLEKVIEHMKRTDEWGQYFPKWMSEFGYNETVAQEYFPLDIGRATNHGFKWKNDAREKVTTLQDRIEICEVTEQPFKIIAQERHFYQKMNLPLPKRCPEQRQKNRMNLRNPRVLNNRTCKNCQKPLQSTFAGNQPEIIYCEECWHIGKNGLLEIF